MTFRREKGATFIDLILLLGLIIALVGLTLPWVDFRIFSDKSFERELVSALEYARQEAETMGCEVSIEINPDRDTFTVSYVNPAECGRNGLLPHPLYHGPYTARSDSGNVIQSVVPADMPIRFSSTGELKGEDVTIILGDGRVMMLRGGSKPERSVAAW